jgi:NAD-dependent dihydropyrimidine dehydrogenase PreA subunit
VLIAVGQENAFPWIERDVGIEFDEWGMPVLDPVTLQSGAPRCSSAETRRWAQEHHLGGRARPRRRHLDRPLLPRRGRARSPGAAREPHVQKMGIHEWSYDNQVAPDARFKVPLKELTIALRDIRQEVELGFDPALAWKEAQRCLNCDVQTVFARSCASSATRAWTSARGLHHLHRQRRGGELRARLNAPAPNPSQALYVSAALRTGRIMVKDEDVCLHCGLCAERCPTGPGTCRNSCST